jgi:hypothetical protein
MRGGGVKAYGSILAAVVIVAGMAAPGCSTAAKKRAAYDPAREAGPRPIKNEAPHIELLLNGKPMLVLRPGAPILAKAYGRGELRGGWKCLAVLWRTDETGWQHTGTEPGAQCGDVAETWIWPEDAGRPYRFTSPGSHEVCVQVYTRQGWLVGREQCARVEIVRQQ